MSREEMINAAWCNLVAYGPHEPKVLFKSAVCDYSRQNRCIAIDKKPSFVKSSGVMSRIFNCEKKNLLISQ